MSAHRERECLCLWWGETWAAPIRSCLRRSAADPEDQPGQAARPARRESRSRDPWRPGRLFATFQLRMHPRCAGARVRRSAHEAPHRVSMVSWDFPSRFCCLKRCRQTPFGDRMNCTQIPKEMGRQDLQRAGQWDAQRESYLSSAFRSVANSRTKSSGTPFLMSGRESRASRRSDSFTRLPNNTTASARSSCREDQRNPWMWG